MTINYSQCGNQILEGEPIYNMHHFDYLFLNEGCGSYIKVHKVF